MAAMNPTRPSIKFKTILLTTDFSETSKKAIDPARMLVARFGARLVVIHVQDTHYLDVVPELKAAGIEDPGERLVTLATDRLRQFVEENFADVAAIPVVLLGIPHAQIVRAAKDYRADLIVMATHGRGFVSDAILGSTTRRVIRRAPCPVLAVRDSRA